MMHLKVFVLFLFFGCLFSFVHGVERLKTHLSVEYLVNFYNYTVETHKVITDDGYILTMHRIPVGIRRFQRRPVIFLQHGLLGSSSNWITQFPQLGLAYLLADAGFDVWMGNTRGNKYSNKHVSYNRKTNPAFWAFSWEHMTDYDLEAMINYALSKSDNQKSLYYIGHSQGTLIMFSKLAADPTFGKKIRKFFALAPIVTISHIKGLKGIGSVLSDFLHRHPQHFMSIPSLCSAVSVPFADQNTLSEVVTRLICRIFNPKVCKFFLDVVSGNSSSQINPKRMNIFRFDSPAGTSVRNILHYILMRNSGRHARMDNNTCLQLSDKSDFQLGNIKTDIHLYWSNADELANQRDIKSYLVRMLPRRFLKQNVRLDGFTHQDFVWGNRAAEEIYKPIIKTIQASIR